MVPFPSLISLSGESSLSLRFSPHTIVDADFSDILISSTCQHSQEPQRAGLHESESEPGWQPPLLLGLFAQGGPVEAQERQEACLDSFLDWEVGFLTPSLTFSFFLVFTLL